MLLDTTAKYSEVALSNLRTDNFAKESGKRKNLKMFLAKYSGGCTSNLRTDNFANELGKRKKPKKVSRKGKKGAKDL